MSDQICTSVATVSESRRDPVLETRWLLKVKVVATGCRPTVGAVEIRYDLVNQDSGQVDMLERRLPWEGRHETSFDLELREVVASNQIIRNEEIVSIKCICTGD